MSKKSQTGNSSIKNKLLQPTIITHFQESEIDVDEHANNIVRYIIYKSGSHKVFKKNDFLRLIPKCGRRFEQIIIKVTEILKNVYGYNLIISDGTGPSQKSYIISNSLPFVEFNKKEEIGIPEDANKILIMFVLAHIFMSKNNITDVSLWAFLKKLSIDIDKEHNIFGDIKDYILSKMTKLKYIDVETDAVTKKMTISWGIRAEKEISKLKILEFVCKIFKEGKPKSWEHHFQIATKQGYENMQLPLQLIID